MRYNIQINRLQYDALLGFVRYHGDTSFLDVFNDVVSGNGKTYRIVLQEELRVPLADALESSPLWKKMISRWDDADGSLEFMVGMLRDLPEMAKSGDDLTHEFCI